MTATNQATATATITTRTRSLGVYIENAGNYSWGREPLTPASEPEFVGTIRQIEEEIERQTSRYDKSYAWQITYFLGGRRITGVWGLVHSGKMEENPIGEYPVPAYTPGWEHPFVDNINAEALSGEGVVVRLAD